MLILKVRQCAIQVRQAPYFQRRAPLPTWGLPPSLATSMHAMWGVQGELSGSVQRVDRRLDVHLDQLNAVIRLI